MRMTQEEFDRERRYQTVTYFLKQLLQRGLISEEEFCQIDTRNREKFKPFTGTLLSGKFLLCTENRVNMGAGKEAKNDAERKQSGA